jgi:hypothetical protein
MVRGVFKLPFQVTVQYDDASQVVDRGYSSAPTSTKATTAFRCYTFFIFVFA